MDQNFKLKGLRPYIGVKKNMKRFFREIGMQRFLANAKGTSIMELVAVLAIIGIFASVAIPNYSQWALRRQVDAESKKLSLELQLARISAIKNNNNVVVNFNVGANQYTIIDDTDNSGAANGAETVKTVPLNPKVSFGFSGAGIIDPNGNAVANSVALSIGGTNLTFNSRGQTDAAGSVYLIPTSEIGQSNVLLRGITIIQATGNIELWEYNLGQVPLWI